MQRHTARLIGYPLVAITSALTLAAMDIQAWQWVIWALGVSAMAAEAVHAHRRA